MSDLTTGIAIGSETAESSDRANDEARVRSSGWSRAAVDARMGYSRLPIWTQPFWTWLTAIALPMQAHRHWEPWHHIVQVVTVCVAAAALGTMSGQSLFDATVDTNVLASIVGGMAAVVLLVHVKVKTSAVLVHYATHNMVLKTRTANKIAADLLSIMILGMPFEDYSKVHKTHHNNATFGGMQDGDARVLYKLGFQPGVSRAQLWKVFWKVLRSPTFHMVQIADRLRMNFIAGSQSQLRVAVAWIFWGAVSCAVIRAQMIPGFVLGVMLPLLIGGNIGSFIELVSRHRWLLTTEMGSKRQLELSHGRFPAPSMPSAGSPWSHYGRWIGQVMAATIARLTVVPGDLTWHHAHHSGLKRDVSKPSPAWTDAAAAYSGHLFTDEQLAHHNYPSIWMTIDAWFTALEREPRQI